MTAVEIIDEVIRMARVNRITKVILFGSRAKGTNWERSDFDLAVTAEDVVALSDFRDALEDIPTLLMFDVVNLNSDMVSLDLKKSIEEEGVLLYEAI